MESNFITPDPWIGLSDGFVSSLDMRWYTGKRLDGKDVLMPLSLLLYTLEGTNGMAAGNSPEEALLQGICEVMERHCLTIIKHKEMTTPLIDPSTIVSPVCKRLMKKLRGQGQELYIRDFSMGLRMPIIGVVRVMGTKCIVTAGVASSREEALTRSLTENSQSEALHRLHDVRGYGYFLRNKTTISLTETSEFRDIDIGKEIQTVGAVLEENGMKVVYFDATRDDIPVPAVIVCVLGAKYFHPKNAHLNFLSTLIAESLAIGKKEQARTLLRRGYRTNPGNKALYAECETMLGSPKNSSSSNRS
jgi:ribosomal protein S12 methylthiotransferase accessory factor